MKKSLLCLALAAASVSVHAGDMYVGAAVSSVDTNLSALGQSGEFDITALNTKVGYAFNKNFAVEGVIAKGFNGDEIGDFEVELDSSFGVNLVANYFFTDSISVYGKLGYTDTTFSDSDGDDASLSGATYTLGGAYHLNKTVAVDLEYTFLPSGEYDDFEIDVEARGLNLGVRFSF